MGVEYRGVSMMLVVKGIGRIGGRGGEENGAEALRGRPGRTRCGMPGVVEGRW
jgi:hypothetical protein